MPVALIVIGLSTLLVWGQAQGVVDLGPGFGGLVSRLVGGNEVQAAERGRDNLVALPLTSMAIPPYTKVRREHYWDAANQQFSTMHLPRSQVTDQMVTFESLKGDFGKLNRRVLARRKGKGYVFQWSDFLPEGTRPGLAGGVPPGKRGLWVSVDRVVGLSELEAGDLFDVLATVEVEADKVEGVVGQPQKQARVDVLVQAGMVIVPERSRPLLPGAPVGGKRPVEAFLALEPKEVAGLARAVALNRDLQVAVRSGRPDEDPELETPGVSPRASKSAEGREVAPMVETIVGGERRLVPLSVVPRGADQSRR